MIFHLTWETEYSEFKYLIFPDNIFRERKIVHDILRNKKCWEKSHGTDLHSGVTARWHFANFKCKYIYFHFSDDFVEFSKNIGFFIIFSTCNMHIEEISGFPAIIKFESLIHTFTMQKSDISQKRRNIWNLITKYAIALWSNSKLFS